METEQRTLNSKRFVIMFSGAGPGPWLGWDGWLWPCFTGTAAPGLRIQNEPLRPPPDQCRGPQGTSWWRECWRSRLIAKRKKKKRGRDPDTYSHKPIFNFNGSEDSGVRPRLSRTRRRATASHHSAGGVLAGGASLHHLAKTCFLFYPLAPT